MNSDLKTELMDWNGCPWVESVPERMHGIPVIRNTRMNADGVLLNFNEGMSADEIAEEFGLAPEAVAEVLAFAGRANRRPAA